MNATILRMFLRTLGIPTLKAPVPFEGDRELSAEDDKAVLRCTSGTPVYVTIPAGLPAGFSCKIVQGAAGTVTVEPAAEGTEMGNIDGHTDTGGMDTLVELVQSGTDKYILIGQTAAAEVVQG